VKDENPNVKAEDEFEDPNDRAAFAVKRGTLAREFEQTKRIGYRLNESERD